MSNKKKFLIFFILGIILLAVVASFYLMLGAKNYSFLDSLKSIFNYDDNIDSEYDIRELRMPRLLADIIVGASLSVAGIIMQGTTKNPMADSGIMGISQGSTLGVVIIVAFFPLAGRYEKMGMATLGAFLVTSLIYLIATLSKSGSQTERMVLSGMAISTLLSSLSMAIILKNGLSNQMVRYQSGSTSNVIWQDIKIALPFFIISIILSILISRGLTIMNLGEEVSKGLGANTKVLRILSTIIVLVLSAISVVIIGPVAYVGLMIPFVVRYLVGNDFRLTIPLSIIFGALFVTLVDLIAKKINPGLEFPIGLLITLVGVPFFIYTSNRQKGDQFYD